MKIDVKFFTEQAYRTLQKNYEEVYNLILNNQSDSSWLYSYLGFEPFESKDYQIEDFDLLNSTNYKDVEFKNCKTLYENLSMLPRYVLCNTRFWAWLIFTKAYNQAINQIGLVRSDIIKNFWLPGFISVEGNSYFSRRDLMLGVISRSYFQTEVSVDEDRSDKYELTKFLVESDNELYRNISYRNIGMLKNVTLALIQVQYDYSKRGITLNPPQVRELMKEASKIGSVMLIDVMSKDEIYSILSSKVDRITKEIK